MFEFESLFTNDNYTNIGHAFHIGQERLGIERILDAEGNTSLFSYSFLPSISNGLLSGKNLQIN